jgi:hypothetical protein
MHKLLKFSICVLLVVLLSKCTKKKQALTRQDSIIIMQAQVDSISSILQNLQNEKDSIPLTRDSAERDRFWDQYGR